MKSLNQDQLRREYVSPDCKIYAIHFNNFLTSSIGDATTPGGTGTETLEEEDFDWNEN